MPPSVIVVGGGIIGCTTAYELAKAGCRVPLFERATPGAEASSAAAGLLAPVGETRRSGLFQRRAARVRCRGSEPSCRGRAPQLFAAAALAISLAIGPAFAAEDPNEAWKALADGGHVALVRHGNAPGPSLGGGGDPPGFRMGDCATQRNLDEAGREEAKALGEAFRSHRVRVDRIQSSPWCRCMETAQLMAVGPVEISSALIPSTDRNPSAPAALRALKEAISNWRGPGTLVLVTHGFTVRALTGIVPGQAETVVLRPTPGSGSGAQVVGRIAPPH